MSLDFSTKVFNEDILHLDLEEHVTVSVEQDEDVHSMSDSKEVSLLGSKSALQGFTKIPRSHHIALLSVLCVLVLVSNIFIVCFYRKSKTSDRWYILTWATFDLSFFALILVPDLITYIVDRPLLGPVVLIVRFCMVATILNFYFYPCFFLALDRFCAVVWPHKFLAISIKLRRFKIVLVALKCVLLTLTFVADNVFGVESLFWKVMSFITSALLVLIILTSGVLYVLIAISLWRANKNISSNKLVSTYLYLLKTTS